MAQTGKTSSSGIADLILVIALSWFPAAVFAVTDSCRSGEVACAVQWAQAEMHLPPMMGQPPMMAQPEQPMGRSIFLAMFAQTLAPGIASAERTWFNNNLNVQPPSAQGNLQGNAYPGGSPNGGKFAQSYGGMLTQRRASQDLRLQAGIAFQMSLVSRDGSRVLANPLHRNFNAGEQIEVAYRSNLPGIVDVFNIDSREKEELIEQKAIAPAQLTVVGPSEFVNAKGEDALRLRLATRGKAKVMVDGATNFALDVVADTEIASGKLAPSEGRIRFVHL